MFYLFILFSYVLGSISFASIIGKINGVNLRKNGTRNPGATNVYREIGPVWGIATGSLDFLKGLLPAIIVKEVLGYGELLVVLVAIAAIIGHNWPFFYGLKGGRGLATTLGTMGVVKFYPGLTAFIIGIFMAWYLTKKLKRNIRIPFITYPLFTIIVLIFYSNIYLVIYGIAIMIIAYFRAWQIEKEGDI